MSVAAFVLAVLLVVALIGWGVTARLLRETREELEQARAAVTVQEQARRARSGSAAAPPRPSSRRWGGCGRAA